VVVLSCVIDFGDVEALSILLMSATPLVEMREPIRELTCPPLIPAKTSLL
jgi:hypothetical protein